MGLPSSDNRRIFAFALAAGLALGVIVYGFVRLVEGGATVDWTGSIFYAALVGLLIALVLTVALKLALRQAAYELYTYAVELTEASIPAPVPFRGDDMIYMRETLGEALAFVPRSDALPRLARDLGGAPDPDRALELAANQIAQHLPVQGAVLLVLDAERSILLPVATWGMASLADGTSLTCEGTAIGRALSELRETEYSGLQVRELLPLQRGPEALTLFCLPQAVGDSPFATLCLLAEGKEVRLNAEQRHFARGVAGLLTLAIQSGVYRRLFHRESERLVAFEELGGLLSGSQRLERALEQVLRVAARVTDSVHGTLLLLDPDECQVRVRITLKEGDVLPLSLTAGPILKHGLAGWALRERRADIIEDTERDTRWLHLPGLGAMRSALVVPLLYGERALGILTLADPHTRHYTGRSLALTSALAAYAVTILARMPYEMMVPSGQVTLARRLLEDHLAPESLNALLAESDALDRALAPQRREVVAIFAGLRGLGDATNTLTPVQVADQILTPYLEALAEVAQEHHAYLAQREGGDVLMLFGFPSAPGDARMRAMHAALHVQAAARRLRGRWRTQLHCEVTLSAGVAAGPVFSGVVGGQAFREFAVMGDAVRDAMRIQRLARPDEVLVADTLAARFGDDRLFPLEPLAPLRFGEAETPRSIFRLAPERG